MPQFFGVIRKLFNDNCLVEELLVVALEIVNALLDNSVGRVGESHSLGFKVITAEHNTVLVGRPVEAASVVICYKLVFNLINIIVETRPDYDWVSFGNLFK